MPGVSAWLHCSVYSMQLPKPYRSSNNLVKEGLPLGSDLMESLILAQDKRWRRA